MYTINNLPTNLVLGRQGEKNVTSFEFDVSSWLDEFPNGVISINVRRPGETEAQTYSAIGVTTVGDTTTWLVDDVDTALDGRGTVSLTLSTPGIANVKKSRAITTVVLEGNIFSANPPSGISQWLIEATNMLLNLENAYDAMTYTFVKYSLAEPEADEDMNDVGGAWMGIYNGTDETAPTDYTVYTWVRIAGINSIARTSGTGAPGTTDTYTITYSDGLTTTYDVVQGNGIASIVRTDGDGSPATTDTYTITFDNGSTTTFPVTHGNGIASIVRTDGDGSPSTTDTYTITFDSGATTTFPVTHGNGIATIVRTSGDGSEGTTDTYTITFNDGTTTTFTVTHGNDSFVHIKYSNYSAPTDGQITDDPNSVYMGICTDINVAAPTTAISYAWSRIKGDTMYATFYVDEDGFLQMNTETGYDGPDFYINQSTGELEVEI